jgi:hypothetical protein
MAAQECCDLALSADLPVLQRLLRGRRRRTRATPALACSALASLGPRATRTRVRKDQDDVPRRPRPVGRILLALTFTKIMCRSYVPMSFTHAVIRSGLADLLELAFAGGKRERRQRCSGNAATSTSAPGHFLPSATAGTRSSSATTPASAARRWRPGNGRYVLPTAASTRTAATRRLPATANTRPPRLRLLVVSDDIREPGGCLLLRVMMDEREKNNQCNMDQSE